MLDDAGSTVVAVTVGIAGAAGRVYAPKGAAPRRRSQFARVLSSFKSTTSFPNVATLAPVLVPIASVAPRAGATLVRGSQGRCGRGDRSMTLEQEQEQFGAAPAPAPDLLFDIDG